MRIERALHGAMQLAHFFGDGQRPPALLGQADAVFAGDRTAPREDLREQLIQRGFGCGVWRRAA